MAKPLPAYYGAASDLDWREAVGECAHNLRGATAGRSRTKHCEKRGSSSAAA